MKKILLSSFLFFSLLLASCVSSQAYANSTKAMSSFNWKKGALHTHTLWSDGRSLPEIAIQTYIDLEFDFVSMTDHNVFQDIPGMKMQIRNDSPGWPPDLTWEEIERSRKILPDDIAPICIGPRWYVALKTFDELHKRFNREGKFLLLPGSEITGFGYKNSVGGTFDAHANVINVPETIRPSEANDVSEIFREDYQKYLQAAAKHPDNDSLFILDHPFWRVWDVSPLAALDNPQIQFFEIFNSVAEANTEEESFTNDKFWDFVLAHRIDRGEQLLYGIANDDAHYYTPEMQTSPDSCNHGWVMVNCKNGFTPNDIIRAMKNADFYATTGVLLDEVDFNADTRTLHVKVQQEADVNYRIEFIVTKKDFDRTIKEKDYLHSTEKFNRRLPIIPNSIGIVAQSLNGTEASYSLKDDDLYVRAVVISDQKHDYAGYPLVPDTKRAWTQPFKSNNE